MFILLLLLLLSLMLLTILHLHLCQPSWCLACEIHGRFFALVNWLTPVLFIEFSYISWSSCPVLKFPIPEKNTSIWEKTLISHISIEPFHSISYISPETPNVGERLEEIIQAVAAEIRRQQRPATNFIAPEATTEANPGSSWFG